MSRGLGKIQRQTLEHLRGWDDWAFRAREVAQHVYGIEWGPEFTDSAYKQVATALRTLCARGLIYKWGPGRYGSESKPDRLVPHVEEPDPELERKMAEWAEGRERAYAKLAALGITARPLRSVGLIDILATQSRSGNVSIS